MGECQVFKFDNKLTQRQQSKEKFHEQTLYKKHGTATVDMSLSQDRKKLFVMTKASTYLIDIDTKDIIIEVESLIISNFFSTTNLYMGLSLTKDQIYIRDLQDMKNLFPLNMPHKMC